MPWTFANIDASPNAREIIRAASVLDLAAADFVPLTEIQDMVDLTMTQWARALVEILDKQIGVVVGDTEHRECLLLAVRPRYTLPEGTDNSSSPD